MGGAGWQGGRVWGWLAGAQLLAVVWFCGSTAACTVETSCRGWVSSMVLHREEECASAPLPQLPLAGLALCTAGGAGCSQRGGTAYLASPTSAAAAGQLAGAMEALDLEAMLRWV